MAEIYRLPFFPAGLPDETLHSRASRYHYLSGNLHDRYTLQDLFGSHTFAPTSNLPSHLLALCARLPRQMATSPDELIEEATLFPYFRPFLSKTQVNACRQAMLSNNAGDLKITMGVVASRIGGDNSFRYCQACVKADDHDHGIAYWHRVHQLPGVLVCPRHGEPLFELGHYWMKSHKHNLFLPSAPEVVSVSYPYQIHTKHIDYLTKIAVDSAALLVARQGMIERADLSTHYRDRAHKQGWLGPGERLRIDDVQQAATRCMELLPPLKCFRFVATGEQWILKLMRKHRSSMHPLKHLLLLTILQSDWASLGQSCGPLFVRTPKAPDRIRANEPTPRSNTEHPLWARKLRPKFIKNTKLDDVMTALATMNPLTSVAKDQGISLASIYRVLRRHPHLVQLRQEQFQKMRRDRFLGEFKNIPAKATQDYMWLYRNDLDWLRRTISTRVEPKKEPFTVIDWAARDDVL